MDYRKMFSGAYVSAADLGDKVATLTIADVKLAKLEDDTGKVKDRGVIVFKETEKALVLCRTNAIAIASMFGPETDNWKNKHITLHVVQVQFGREQVPGLRVMGSPDIPEAIDATVKLPRKRPFIMKLAKTGARHAEG